MPRTKNHLSYPKILSKILLKAFNSGHVVHFDSYKEADKRRWEIYAYIRAVKHSKDPDDTALILAAHQVSMRLEGDPTGGPAELHIFNKENSPLAIAMRKSLGLNTTEEAAAASEKIMQELLEIEPQETPQTPEFDPMKTFIPMRRRMDPQLDEKTREALKKYGARE